MKCTESKIVKNDAVGAYIDKMDPRLKDIARKLRSIITKVLPESQERIWMGVPNYALDGVGISSIADYSHHINLYFLFGAKMQSKLLQGTGKGIRHISIASREDIDEKEIARLLKRAASILASKSQLKRPRKLNKNV